MITEAVGPTPEQKAQWEEEGYIVLENALRGAQLQRLQAAFDKAAVECKEDWLARVARGGVTYVKRMLQNGSSTDALIACSHVQLFLGSSSGGSTT